MPQSAWKDLNERLDRLEHKMEGHLEQSGFVLADLAWIKKLMFLGVSAILVTCGGVIVQLVIRWVRP